MSIFRNDMGKEMLLFKCWEIFSYHIEYFPHAENLELLFFCCTAFIDKIIRGNVTYYSFHQLVVNMGKYWPQNGKVHENNLCLTALLF